MRAKAPVRRLMRHLPRRSSPPMIATTQRRFGLACTSPGAGATAPCGAAAGIGGSGVTTGRCRSRVTASSSARVIGGVGDGGVLGELVEGDHPVAACPRQPVDDVPGVRRRTPGGARPIVAAHPWIGPSVARNDRTSVRPVRAAMISAQIATAVSSGVRAPRSRPIGRVQARQRRVVDAGLAQPLDAVGVGAPAAHGAEVADVGGERGDDGRYVELVVVGEHAHGVARRERAADLLEEAVGPVDDDLVGQREPGLGGEHRDGRRTRSPGSRGPWRPGPARR